MGFDLVDVERSGRGLLAVTIDVPAAAGRGPLNVDDCERVTRQLQYLLEVEGIDYARLEVGSPGVNRPLRTAADFARFAGERVTIVLHAPMPQAHNRKRFSGVLQPPLADGRFSLIYEVRPAAAAADKRRSGKVKPTLHELCFGLDEIASAHLDPTLDFKPKRARGDAAQDLETLHHES